MYVHIINYSNHINTDHPISDHFTFQTLFCMLFKWSDHEIRWTVQMLLILEHETHLDHIYCTDVHDQKIRLQWGYKCQTSPDF